MIKTCNKCAEEKSVSEFFKDKANKTDGLYSICKKCKSISQERWRENNRDKYNAKMRAYNSKNYQRLRIMRYNLTPKEHARMLLEQKGVCAICGDLPKGKRPLAIDHNHTTEKVRGLLCYGCNRALHVLETVELLAKAQSYLAKHST